MDQFEQLSLFQVMTPPWIECFQLCRHFDSHPEWQPDTFPWPPDMKRCRYCDHEYGTSGKQFYMKQINGSIEMFCVHFEERK